MQARPKEHLRPDAALSEVAAECRALDAELSSTEPHTRAQRLELVRRTRSLLQAITRQLELPQRPMAAYDEDYGEDTGLAGEAMATYRREAMELRWLIIRRAAETVFGGAETQAWIDRQVPAKTLRYSTIDGLQDVLTRLEKEQRLRLDHRASRRTARR